MNGIKGDNDNFQQIYTQNQLTGTVILFIQD